MGESRNVRVKWTADTQQAVHATDRYKKSVTGVSDATKQASKESERVRGEFSSQANTLVGLGAAVQFGVQAYQQYNAITKEAAAASINAAVAAEKLSGRINAVAESSRLAAQAQQSALISRGLQFEQAAEQLAEASLVRRGRVGQAAAALRRINPLTGAIEEVTGVTEKNRQLAAELGSDPAQQRGRFTQESEAIIEGINDPRARARASAAQLEELQKANNFNLSTVRKAAETQ